MTANAQHSSVNESWATPPEAIEPVRKVFGGWIDLDPCSFKQANRIVQAKDYCDLSAGRDGLVEDWAKRTFLNPPYCRKVGAWLERADHFAGSLYDFNTIALVNATPDSSWFRPLWNWPICFAFKRIRFLESPPARKKRLEKLYDRARTVKQQQAIRSYMDLPPPEGLHGFFRGPSPTHGSCFVLFSRVEKYIDRFDRIFSKVGHVVMPRKG